jgi:hypothetical protein
MGFLSSLLSRKESEGHGPPRLNTSKVLGSGRHADDHIYSASNTPVFTPREGTQNGDNGLDLSRLRPVKVRTSRPPQGGETNASQKGETLQQSAQNGHSERAGNGVNGAGLGAEPGLSPVIEEPSHNETPSTVTSTISYVEEPEDEVQVTDSKPDPDPSPVKPSDDVRKRPALEYSPGRDADAPSRSGAPQSIEGSPQRLLISDRSGRQVAAYESSPEASSDGEETALVHRSSPSVIGRQEAPAKPLGEEPAPVHKSSPSTIGRQAAPAKTANPLGLNPAKVRNQAASAGPQAFLNMSHKPTADEIRARLGLKPSEPITASRTTVSPIIRYVFRPTYVVFLILGPWYFYTLSLAYANVIVSSMFFVSELVSWLLGICFFFNFWYATERNDITLRWAPATSPLLFSYGKEPSACSSFHLLLDLSRSFELVLCGSSGSLALFSVIVHLLVPLMLAMNTKEVHYKSF